MQGKHLTNAISRIIELCSRAWFHSRCYFLRYTIHAEPEFFLSPGHPPPLCTSVRVIDTIEIHLPDGIVVLADTPRTCKEANKVTTANPAVPSMLSRNPSNPSPPSALLPYTLVQHTMNCLTACHYTLCDFLRTQNRFIIQFAIWKHNEIS